MATIAFIGLGLMGGPMSAQLVRAGHTVLGYDSSEASRRAAATNDDRQQFVRRLLGTAQFLPRARSGSGLGGYAAKFSVRLMSKDLHLALDAASGAGQSLPVGTRASALYDALVASDPGLDASAIIRQLDVQGVAK